MARTRFLAFFVAILDFWHIGEVAAAGKKPLFEYDDHHVMLNDYGRNQFYWNALEKAVANCDSCIVLDLGAGSGLLSMMAASLGAVHVIAIEANPDLAALAEKTIQRNRDKLFPTANVTVIPGLSTKLDIGQFPGGRPADILVTETFGTMLMGEGAMNFVPDARRRLLRPGGVMIPAGGCQYATLVDVPALRVDSATSNDYGGHNLTRMHLMRDTLYWKASMGGIAIDMVKLINRTCILEVDFKVTVRDDVPINETFQITATTAGTGVAVLYDWDVWLDDSREDILSTAPGVRNFAGDVAWGWLLQPQEEFDENWRVGAVPVDLVVQAGDQLNLGVEYLARGISFIARIRRSLPAEITGRGQMPPLQSPRRMLGVARADFLEANEHWLPANADLGRQNFVSLALEAAVSLAGKNGDEPGTAVLDASGGGGSLRALLDAAKKGTHALLLTQRSGIAEVVRGMARDNGVETRLEAYAADPRDLVESMMPLERRADVVIVDPPGTPLGTNPFSVLPGIRKRLLKPEGLVVPGGACFEVGLADSADISRMFTIPGGKWQEIDLTVWNEEAWRHSVLDRLVPHTKRFGSFSTMGFSWLSIPKCVFEVNLNTYGLETPPPETDLLHNLEVIADGSAHAIVGQWVIWDSLHDQNWRLDGNASNLNRQLTWPHYFQVVADPSGVPSLLEPVRVHAGEVVGLSVKVRQGKAKITGSAGPEISLSLQGAHRKAPKSDESGHAPAKHEDL